MTYLNPSVPHTRPVAAIKSIQLLRGIAALLVVLLHIAVKGEQYGNNALQNFTIGGAGVDLFFIISGYIMCLSTHNRSLSSSTFMFARARRILPLYWLSTTMALVIFLYNPALVNRSGGTTSIWASYLLFPNGDKFLNANGWTLSIELAYYIVFGLFIGKGTYKAILFSSVILLSLVITGYCIHSTHPLFLFSTDPLFLEFVMGMGLFNLFAKKKLYLKPQYGLLCCGIALAVVVAEMHAAIPGMETQRVVYWGLPMLLFFTGLISMEPYIQHSHTAVVQLLAHIGDASYSLYLFHPFLLGGTAMLLKGCNAANDPLLFASVLIIVAVGMGYLIYWFVEKPLTALVKRL